MIKILVMEDEKQLSSALKSKLTNEGFEVTACGDGQQGLAKVATEIFSIILLDLVMPVKDGFEFLDSYLNSTREPLPILVLTNLSDFSSKIKAYKKGAVSYLIKTDVSMDDIVSKIKEMLG
jgi:two-component system response regulator ResD